jgi:hypothetical protein
MDDANATWFEKKMVTAPSYVPSTVNNNIAFVQDALATDSSGHGYGASMFMTYMAGKQGDAFIGDVTKLKWDNYQPIDALKNKTSSVIAVDWQLFCQSYMKLAVYGAGTSPSSTQVMSLYTGGYVFGPYWEGLDTTFNWAGAPDLSAKVYRLQFAPGMNWMETDDLKLTFFGNDPDTAPLDAYYIVCTYANSAYKFVCGSSDHEYLVKNIKSVYDAGGAVYVMVVNGSATSPYTGNRVEPLNLKVERKEDFVARLHKSHEFHVTADCARVAWNSEILETGILDNGIQAVTLEYTFDTITWDGVSFSSAHEVVEPGTDFYVEGIVDPVDKTMTCTVTYSYHDTYSSETLDWTFTFTDLPLYPGIDYINYPEVAGREDGAACALYVTDISRSNLSSFASKWWTDWTWGGVSPWEDYIYAEFSDKIPQFP